MPRTEDITNRFEAALLSLDRVEAGNLIKETGRSWSPMEQVEKMVVPALERIGEGWETGRIALSQVYMSGRICEELVQRILPKETSDRKHQPKMAIAVLQDYHLLGKRIVLSALRASGYELRDYGQMDADELVTRSLQDNLEILFISTLMLSSALQVKKVKEKLARAESPIRIVVGGAPFRLDSTLWKEVGADAMGRGALDAVTLIDNIMGGPS